MAELNPALVEINQRNRDFWEVQKRLTATRMANEEILAAALEALAFEDQRRVPVYFRNTFQHALAEADDARRRFLGQQSRKGGRARKSDPLQDLIVDIARQRPNITERELLEWLKDQCPIPPIAEIVDETISFASRDGRLAEAPISGLKDRLSRAKKQIRNSR